MDQGRTSYPRPVPADRRGATVSPRRRLLHAGSVLPHLAPGSATPSAHSAGLPPRASFMINVVTTGSTQYTVESLVERHGAHQIRLWSYASLFRSNTLPTGTWLFTDHERLSPYDLSSAAVFANRLKEHGARIVNHPALVRGRFELLRRLREAGINDFSAYRAESDPRPSRFPVFIRNEYDHNAKALALIESQTALDRALEELETQGIPLVGKLVIEYSGEQALPDVWCRLSSYCVDGQIIAHHMAFFDHWVVKDGFDRRRMTTHRHEQQFLEMERRFVFDNQHADIIGRAFQLARIQYGRADCSLHNGRVQVFEINTNPNHASESDIYEDIHPAREAIIRHSEKTLQAAILGLGTEEGEPLRPHGSFWDRVRLRRKSWLRTLRRL